MKLNAFFFRAGSKLYPILCKRKTKFVGGGRNKTNITEDGNESFNLYSINYIVWQQSNILCKRVVLNNSGGSNCVFVKPNIRKGLRIYSNTLGAEYKFQEGCVSMKNLGVSDGVLVNSALYEDGIV